MTAFNTIVFVVLPYVALVVALVATVERYRRHGFSCTSLSTQFLENRLHFWALAPFHAGILLILVGHAVAFAVPSAVLAWNAVPARLFILESVALAAGLLALGGFAAVAARRVAEAPIRRGTAAVDWAVYALLFLQIATGVVIAIRYPWGSSWFASVASPYLWSLVQLQPDAALVTTLPWLIRLHVAGTWLLAALFAFSKLVHVVVVPNAYLWRAPQVVRWYQKPAVPGRRS